MRSTRTSGIGPRVARGKAVASTKVDTPRFESVPPPEEARFEIREPLGVGAMGVVYRAYDRTRRHQVALKALRRFGGSHLFRFKQEFRSLTGLVHPNLVTLYELHLIGETWCLSMELIEGAPVLQYVRPYRHLLRRPQPAPDPDGAELRLGSQTGPASSTATLVAPPPSKEERKQWSSDYGRAVREAVLRPARLRQLLPQLVAGIRTLHAAGKLHRDLKPSNVLVERSGRVVVCDFGLVLERRAEEKVVSDRAGTPAYMSPEQAMGGELDESSDWYSLGVMLFRAITGRLPFSGSREDVLTAKRTGGIEFPSGWKSSREADLLVLSGRLMHPDPAARPSGEEIEDLVSPARRGIRRSWRAAPTKIPFIGRHDQLEVLREAFEASEQGEGVAVFVRGKSGMGKSALVQSFLDQVQETDDIVLLEGRCYQRESVPHKALDALIDALSSKLLELPRADVRELLGRDVGSVARLFPVLRRVPAIEEAFRASPMPKDPQELRSRAFDALLGILSRLAETRPMVIFTDDLQWGDIDSAPLLLSLLHHPDRPSALWIATFREEEVATSALLRELTGSPGDGTVVHLELGALSFEESAELARRLLRSRERNAQTRAERIASEAGGNPFLVAELAVAFGASQGDERVLDVDRMLSRRVARLPESVRRLLTAVCMCGRPLQAKITTGAAEVEDEAAALATLEAQRLVRIRQVADHDFIEPYHDRVREAVASCVPARAIEGIHRRLARLLEQAPHPDPLALTEHWFGAGDRGKAGGYALDAAALVERALAFERAAFYYDLALRLCELDEGERSQLLERRGDALVNAGALHVAAESFEAAASGAERRRRIDLMRKAFEAYLRAGALSEGIVRAERVLEAVGLSMPKTYYRAMISVLLHRMWFSVRGFGFVPRPPELVDPDDMLRLDVCWSIASGLSFVNAVYGTAFQTQHLAYALKAGDAHRSIKALCLNIGFESMPGPSYRLTRFLRRTRDLVTAHGDKGAIGFWRVVHGLSRFLSGRFRKGLEELEAGERIMLEHDAGYRWQADLSIAFQMGARLYLGRLRELTRLVELRLRDARARGNHFLDVSLRSWRTNFSWLVLDRPDEARENVRAIEPITALNRQFHQFHFYEMVSHCNIELYEGDPAAAWARLEECWPKLERSMLLRIQFTKVEGCYLRARTAVAAARDGVIELSRAKATVDAMTSSLRRAKVTWAVASGHMARACLESLEGNPERSLGLLEQAIEGFEAADMALHAVVARQCRGALIQGDQGRVAMAQARTWFEQEGVANPPALIRLMAPGFPCE